MAEDWKLRGACRNMDPKLFYPTTNQPNMEAKKACKNCPVWNQCYLYALRKEDWGFWAGHTEQERRKLRKAAGVTLEQWRPMDFFRVNNPCESSGGAQKHYRRGEKPCQACSEAWNRHKNGYEQMGFPL